MICPKCGKDNSIETKFCAECGAKLIDLQATDNSKSSAPNVNITTGGWFYSFNNQRFGPVDHFTVSNMLTTGNITPETLVWRAGMPNWLPARETELFNANPVYNQAEPTPPAIPVQPVVNMPEQAPITKVPNSSAWLLATIPLGTSMIASSIGGQTGYYIGIVLAFLLNIVFLFIDDSILRKNGVDTKKWSWCGLILIPVYLFIRSAKTGRKFGYAIMWCVMAFLDFCVYTAVFAV